MSDSQGPRAFYLPAMSLHSREPGRVEQFVTARLGDHRVIVSGAVTHSPTKGFYLPAMGVLSNVPGRLERMLSETFRNRDGRPLTGTVRAEIREFYLPATARLAIWRR